MKHKNQSENEEYTIFALYWKSGHKYFISKWPSLGMAHVIAHRAERNLTDGEREEFGYTISRTK